MARKNNSEEAILTFSDSCIKESREAKRWRMNINRDNYDMYHGRQDMSHKLKGQSKEFLPSQAMGVEQVAQFMHQGLLDFGDWFSANLRPGVDEALFDSTQVRDILQKQFDKCGFYNFVLDSLKSAILGSLAIGKVRGCLVPARRFITSEGERGTRLMKTDAKAFQLKFDLVPQRNFHIDPNGKGLYKIEEIDMDTWELEQFAKDYPKMFNRDALALAIAHAAGSGQDTYNDESDKEGETNQPNPPRSYRKVIKLRECWGNILDPHTGKMIYERKQWIIADEKFLIVPPRDYPTWDQSDPYVVGALLRTPNSQWHRALADFPTMLNKTKNEIFNLIVDSGIMSVYGIKQLRENWLEDPSEADEIVPGSTLGVNAACPPGAKVLERLDTNSAGAGEAHNAFQLVAGELNASMLQNNFRAGMLPARSVKATEIVATENAIDSVSSGISKSYEAGFVTQLLEKSWNLCLANFKRMDKDELRATLGHKPYERLGKLSDKTIYAKSYGGFEFKVFGISQTLNKIKDFRKLTAVLQAIATNAELTEAFVRKYSFTKILGEIIKALDINEGRIKHDKVDQQLNDLSPEAPGLASANQPDMSALQVPQAASDAQFQEEAGGGAMFSEVAQ